jgi:hypothetical protein
MNHNINNNFNVPLNDNVPNFMNPNIHTNFQPNIKPKVEAKDSNTFKIEPNSVYKPGFYNKYS